MNDSRTGPGGQKEALISCRDVWKTFRHRTGGALLRDYVARWFGNREAGAFHALKGISLEVFEGEGLAVIGGNGAGKSTLLSVLAGLAAPDRGTVEVRGRIAALMELGSGFHPDLTGTENVFLNAALLGFREAQTREIFDSIVQFAGVQEFIHQPLRSYSSGMSLRLAFSVAMNVNPDVLIIDEVMAVGDQEFQAKCFERIRGFRGEGKTFLCVSHNRAVLEELCDRAVWLDHGEPVMEGRTSEVLDAYEGRKPRNLAREADPH